MMPVVSVVTLIYVIIKHPFAMGAIRLLGTMMILRGVTVVTLSHITILTRDTTYVWWLVELASISWIDSMSAVTELIQSSMPLM